MSKLTVDQKSVYALLSDKKANFLIPDYQRPYTWSKDECETLWTDLINFAVPEGNAAKFDTESEYYLGSIVTFLNPQKKQEVIDGQQRLTTLLLLLRAFYDRFAWMGDDDSQKTRQAIARCIWKTTEFGAPLMDQLKIDSQVISDDTKTEFLNILKEGEITPSQRSSYAKNFDFFQRKVEELASNYPSYVSLFAVRILNNVIFLPIEADSQDTALRIFSTLNDRGLPLSDADIFKSEFYKFFSQRGEKDTFVARWKSLESTTKEAFDLQRRLDSPLDELFVRYMYFERARRGTPGTTTESLRAFYSADNFCLLKYELTFNQLEALAEFWRSITLQNTDLFSERVLKRLFVLHYAPNSMWTYLVSAYFLTYADQNHRLPDEEFFHFLQKITAFILAYAIVHPGVSALRAPVFSELANIVQRKPVTFSDYLFDGNELKQQFNLYSFTNQRPITKALLAWLAFDNEQQKLIKLSDRLQIEHIYSKKRSDIEPLLQADNLESIGNKSLLEASVNIRASDYRFEDKKKIYQGLSNNGTQIEALLQLAEQPDFSEHDIESRKEAIFSAFVNFLKNNSLLK